MKVYAPILFLITAAPTLATDIMLFGEKGCKNGLARCKNIKAGTCCHLPQYKSFESASVRGFNPFFILSTTTHCKTPDVVSENQKNACVNPSAGGKFTGAHWTKHLAYVENGDDNLTARGETTGCVESMEAEEWDGEI